MRYDSDKQTQYACHNCKRRHLRCDRAVPQCLKCIKRGRRCLGYQEQYRWEYGLSSRGKMDRLKFQDKQHGCLRPTETRSDIPTSTATTHNNSNKPNVRILGDPVYQDLNDRSRLHLSYFANEVCKDLVMYDDPCDNPFRNLIPMTINHDVLRHIMIANGALHLSNRMNNDMLAVSSVPAGPADVDTVKIRNPSKIQQQERYIDALSANHYALKSLNLALEDVRSEDIDPILAAILLFIDFELLDTGKGNWRLHVMGFRRLLDLLITQHEPTMATASSLRAALISSFQIFDIIGSTTISTPPDPGGDKAFGPPSLIRDTEGNHCTSCPATLLHIIQRGARLSSSSQNDSCNTTLDRERKARLLLKQAYNFDASGWAAEIQKSSPRKDQQGRAHVAWAHRAAVLINLARILLTMNPQGAGEYDPEALVSEVLGHIAFIRPNSPLFKATIWPAFIAGAQTQDPKQQEWVVNRFRELWEFEPWGLIRSALGLLDFIWVHRRKSIEAGRPVTDWLQDIKSLGSDWIIM